MKNTGPLFMKKLKEIRKSIRHNFSNELEYEFLLELFGGKELLKKDYPAVYTIIRNSRKSRSKVKNIHPPLLGEEKESGWENSARICYLNYSPVTTLSTSSKIQRTEENPSLIIFSHLFDVTNDKYVDGYSICKNNCFSLDGYTAVEACSLIQSREREFKVISTFFWIEYDENKEPRFESVSETSDNIKVIGTDTLVDKVKVQDPDTIKNPSRENTRIVYDREGQAKDDYDYDFPLVLTEDKKYASVKIPFQGSVTFKSPCVPYGVDKNDGFKLMVEHDTFGAISFKDKMWEAIKWEIKGEEVSWKFPDEWGAWIKKENFKKGLGFSFYCQMNILVTYAGIPLPKPVLIVITSKGEVHEDPAYKKIKPIDIWWGCIGKDTEVRMADNRVKKACDIRIGDFIVNHAGDRIEVKDILKGQEEKMVFIKSENKENIFLTEEHPLLTKRGMVMAKDLNAADILVMDYGEAEILSLYEQEYKDEVFSLVFHTESNFIGNHFVVGDLAAQQHAMAQEKQIKKEKELFPFQKELCKLIEEINKK